jgi:hypothetical protein
MAFFFSLLSLIREEAGLTSQSKRVSKAKKKATGLALAPIFLILQQVLAAHALDSPYGVRTSLVMW